ncbi:unnamed protein product [Schistocephalus solidus]|uniref:ORF2 n=1 Tax=Schistocephalus solidus TaxID=70667 RepID=A0A183SWV6_SCHSO|nr:unnamed protein product [Schistocephalus solidus]
MPTYHFAERSTPPPGSHLITYGQAATFAFQSTSDNLYRPDPTTLQTFTKRLHEVIRSAHNATHITLGPASPPKTAVRPTPSTSRFKSLKPYQGRLAVCTPDSLPILPADQVAIEVTVSSPSDLSSTEDSAAP